MLQKWEKMILDLHLQISNWLIFSVEYSLN